MDPDICLRDCLRLAEQIIEEADEEADKDVLMHSTEAVELAEAVQNLSNWIQRGGFLPKDWRKT